MGEKSPTYLKAEVIFLFKCTRCGVELKPKKDSSNLVCSSCGKKLVVPAPAPEPKIEKKKIKKYEFEKFDLPE